MNKNNLCNICVLFLKKKEWKDVMKYADDTLELDKKYSKALFLKGKALIETTEF